MIERLTPVNKALILSNVAIYVLQWAFGDVLFASFALWPPEAAQYGYPPFRVWQLLTYGFMHDPHMLAHILFNMLALYIFGGDLERLFGPRRYLIYYLFCVVGAALMHLIVVTVSDMPPLPTVGASGGVFGLLLAYGMAFPRRVLVPLFPPIPMPAWLFVTLYGALELVLGVTQTATGIAHFAHLGGMATGFVLIRYWSAQRRAR